MMPFLFTRATGFTFDSEVVAFPDSIPFRACGFGVALSVNHMLLGFI
jgi:hypothetical protein